VSATRFPNLSRLRAESAHALDAKTVFPSVTAVAMTSLLSGVPPTARGVDSDRFRVPKPSLTTIPHVTSIAGLHRSGFVQHVPWLLRPLTRRITQTLGFTNAHFARADAHCGDGEVDTGHDSTHPLDCTIPIFLDGAGVHAQEIQRDLSLLDVPATVLWAMGLPIPEQYTGVPICDAFTAPTHVTHAATAA